MKIFIAVLLIVFLSGCALPLNQGWDAYQAGNTALAEQHLTRAINIDDRPGEAWNLLAVIYDRTNRSDQAIRALQMGARHGDPQAQQNLVKKGLPVPSPDLRKAAKSRPSYCTTVQSGRYPMMVCE